RGAFGGSDGLGNNGGGPRPGPAAGVRDEAVENAVELLLLSAIRLTNLCLPHLEASGRGRIVNVESSSVRAPIDNLALSNALRPGVVGWMKTLAREVGSKGITVNTIAPGLIDTERLRSLPGVRDVSQIPVGRVGDPAEIAAVACFLASDRAGRDLLRRGHRPAREALRAVVPLRAQGRDPRAGEQREPAGSERQPDARREPE